MRATDFREAEFVAEKIRLGLVEYLSREFLHTAASTVGVKAFDDILRDSIVLRVTTFILGCGRYTESVVGETKRKC